MVAVPGGGAPPEWRRANTAGKGMEEIQQMVAELGASDPIYRPSEFWRYYNDINYKQLEEAGLANFKLTANQNYHNFMPVSPLDPKIRRLVRLWLSAPTLRPLFFRLEHGYARVGSALVPQAGLLKLNQERLRVYCIFLGLVWTYSKRIDRFKVLDRLDEPQLGNPIQVRHKGRLVSQDLATSSREFNAIMGEVAHRRGAATRLVVGELGAGYGRLAHVFLGMTPCRYLIFDIPPALNVAQWYLANLFPHKKVFRFRRFDKFSEVEKELASAEIAFFTANQIAKFPDGYFDLMVSISSLHEMRFGQIDHYLKLLAQLTKEFLYIKQYHRYPNTHDNIIVERSAYKVPGDWEVLFDRTERVYTDFFEVMLKKTAAA